MQANTNTNSEYAWTGDTKGYEFCLKTRYLEAYQ